MELRDLKSFIAVAQHGSFTKASQQLFVSQPSLSKNIKRLEEFLQVELLERSTRYVRLTDAGRIVYEQSKKALLALEEIPLLLNDLKQIHSGSIKIGIPPLIGTLFFPELARRFHEKYPNVQLELTELGAKRIWELVDNGHVNLGFVVLPTNETLFQMKPFIEDEFVLFIHENHPLAGESEISISQLKDEKFILFSDEFTLHDLVIQACKDTGFIPNIIYKSSQWDLIIELVSSQLGITLLPKSIYKKQVNQQVKIVNLTETLRWNLGIITKKDSYLPFAVKEFLAFTERL
ncbi:LysR family transcriptional regulator [Lysinibacillus odysseyi]|uniref:LysR family transcriptional regulator n=1 Tax=Lysinibacillus odysseyi 34hs-1 = NBRC 100172 TaxID=1220589 RepID=A0A0A3IU07_9BACI|nr:LysR family transcriptional regulator [Lysinibacillus odysseyi]KGR88201.1 LysR family transcriptional regulator [Lysinibacillus odysseyi 34hs-1 = NBRC 100172]